MPPISGRLAIISSRASSELKQFLTSEGLQLLGIPDNTFVYDQVCTHPDLFVHPCSGVAARLFLASELHGLLGDDIRLLSRRAEALGMTVERLDQKLGGQYPQNVLLNGVELGDYVMGNPMTLSPQIIKAHEANGRKLLAVKQGYTKCSVAVVRPQALITEDQGIAKAALGVGMEVLLLDKGHVGLDGFEYGFIGGCCGKLREDWLLFNGNLANHPHGADIVGFCRKHGVEVAQTEGPLTDVGSIFVF